ncbi:MAG: iron-containing alcohol dehydrogenase [Rhizobiaceae bacterium]
MTPFSLTKHPAMTMAPGASKELGQRVTEVTGANSRVLLVCDPTLVALGLSQPLIESMEEQGHSVIVFDDLQSDPKEKSVNAATAIAHENQVDCVVGLGGGSALDTSKVVAALAASGEGCEPYRLALKQLPFRKTALITLPTTAGTGSETTGTSIISQPDGVKNWFWGQPLKPDLALMDPELTLGLPAYWTLYTGLDALVHSVESRTNRYRYEANDPLAEKGIVEAASHLVEAVNNPTSIEARTGMMLAAAYGGLAIANTGCAVAHNIGHALGSLAGIPHGRAVSVALAQTMEWTIEGNPRAFERVAELLGAKHTSQIAEKLHGIADQCGESLSLSNAEKDKLSEQALADDMVADANIAMLEATARDASRTDVEQLASRILSA